MKATIFDVSLRRGPSVLSHHAGDRCVICTKRLLPWQAVGWYVDEVGQITRWHGRCGRL